MVYLQVIVPGKQVGCYFYLFNLNKGLIFYYFEKNVVKLRL